MKDKDLIKTGEQIVQSRGKGKNSPVIGNDLLGSRIAGGNTAYKRSESDFYPTPSDVTVALMKFLDLPKDFVIWEPACGEGHMVNAIEGLGYEVIGTDIQTGTDFLNTTLPDERIDWIITNPPFSLADRFIETCKEFDRPFALMLKSQYWHAKKRLPLFEQCRPTHILPLTWRPDFLFKTRGGGSPLMDVCWCVWDTEQSQTTTYYHPLDRPKIAWVG